MVEFELGRVIDLVVQLLVSEAVNVQASPEGTQCGHHRIETSHVGRSTCLTHDDRDGILIETGYAVGVAQRGRGVRNIPNRTDLRARRPAD